MSSPIATTGVASGDNGHISSKLIMTLVGCLCTSCLIPSHVPGLISALLPSRSGLPRWLVAFAAIVIGFLLVSRKSCCAPRRSHPDASLPSYHDPHHRHAHPPTVRRGCPIASLCDFRCTHCLKRGDKGSDDHSPRVSLESLSLPPPPYPQAAHSPPSARPRGPTPWLPRSDSATSFNRASLTSAIPATPARPPPPSYYYASRGPVAGPAPRYRQS
ncbi:hypothetical protein LXA43DRAFT_610383 [Ganoderma leucocontextum]|nr:hypothetical protein LXA43DRAFT_610383 [Ganoderma leucocontextum]